MKTGFYTLNSVKNPPLGKYIQILYKCIVIIADNSRYDNSIYRQYNYDTNQYEK